MRRRYLIVVLLLVMIACRAIIPASFPPASPAVTLTPSTTPAPTIEPQAASPMPRRPVVPPALAPLPNSPFSVRLHPDGPLYVGDQVSLEIIAPPGVDLERHKVEVQVDPPEGATLGPVGFGRFGIAGRTQATLLWAWDTSGLKDGAHTLNFSIIPDGPSWTQAITLLPRSSLPASEAQAHWATAKSEYCVVHYITGTAAERDLPQLLAMADEQARDASQRMGIELTEPISITLIPRVLGHGGFTNQEISVSYLDRNYAGSGTAMVLHHEMIHLLDNRLGGDLRPTILVEGLAVYLTGGHFKPEPLLPRAAALLAPSSACIQPPPVSGPQSTPGAAPGCGLDWYIPLASLTNDFYFSQHETGYLEAGALVEYMVNTWGWQAFSDFYRDIHPQKNASQAEEMDAALKTHFGISLDQLEKGFLDALKQERLTPELVDDVRLSVNFYNTVRRYQEILDPSAYFLTAWLPDGEKMRQRGIVADYLRHPSAPENVSLETLLVAADAYIRSGDFARTGEMLDAVNAMLDVFSRGGGINAFSVTSLLREYQVWPILSNRPAARPIPFFALSIMDRQKSY